MTLKIIRNFVKAIMIKFKYNITIVHVAVRTHVCSQSMIRFVC